MAITAITVKEQRRVMTAVTTSKIGLKGHNLTMGGTPPTLQSLPPSLGINLISDPPQKSVIGHTPEMVFETTVNQAGFYF